MSLSETTQESVYFVDKIGYKNECGDCTMCCQGFLPVQVYDYIATEGSPCHFVEPGGCGGGCSIYDKRPEVCQQYMCAWLQFPVTFPKWMKPNKSDVLLTFRNLDDLPGVYYLQMKEGYNTVRAEVLNWVIRFATSNGYNLEYQVGTNWYHSGSPEFIEHMAKRNMAITQAANNGKYPTGPLPYEEKKEKKTKVRTPKQVAQEG